MSFRTASETLGCTFLPNARTADLTPDAQHLVAEVDGNFVLHRAVGGSSFVRSARWSTTSRSRCAPPRDCSGHAMAWRSRR